MPDKVDKELVERFITVVMKLHDVIIKTSGGETGIRDRGGLYNSCYKVLSVSLKHQNDPLYVSAFTYAEFAKRHHFVDGNKRTAHILGKIFLEEGRYHLIPPYNKVVDFIVSIAKDDLNINKIKKWLKKNSSKIKKHETNIDKYLKRSVEKLYSGSNGN